MWQALHEAAKDHGFTVLAVALDEREPARPWIEAASPGYPCLIDREHRVAELYNMVNVPTAVWIDERRRIVRPNDVAFGTDTFRHVTGIDAAKHVGLLRAWVRGEGGVMPAEKVRALQVLPTATDQLARAEFALGWWLAQRGRTEAAARHFVRGGELAPHDFTIRRGSMPIRGIDPMGPHFRTMVKEWTDGGQPYYRPLPDA